MSKTPARYKVSRRPRANTRPLHSITPSSETSNTTHAELGPHCEHNLCDDNRQDYLDGGQACSICVVVMVTKISRIDKMTISNPRLQYRTQCFTFANLYQLIKKTNSLITDSECLILSARSLFQDASWTCFHDDAFRHTEGWTPPDWGESIPLHPTTGGTMRPLPPKNEHIN